MEVEILSKETIKPSSPTPPFLKSSKLSLLDQLSPVAYSPLVFFYSNLQLLHFHDPSSTLKSSLSHILTNFYLLAGRIKDGFIECSDDGAIVFTARVIGTLSEFLKQPKLELLDQFLPCPILCSEPSESYPQVSIQINTFSCGGIAIAVCFLHKIIDAYTLSTFMKSWGSIAKQSLSIETAIQCSDYRAISSMFPPRDLSLSQLWLSKESPFLSRGKSRTQRFVIDAISIKNLKENAKSKNVPKPTSVEVVTAFVWKYAMKAARTRSGTASSSSITHLVNIRKRMEPSLPENSVGNILWRALSYYDSSKDEIEEAELVHLIRESFDKINSDYIEKMVGVEGFEKISKLLKEIGEMYEMGGNSYAFSSWRNLGLNEVDFGWGKPLWVSSARLGDLVLKNLVLLLDSERGTNGMEVWMVLEDEEMDNLEHDLEFLAFASVNPSIDIP